MRLSLNRFSSSRGLNKQAQVQFLLDLLGWLTNGCSTSQALQMMAVCAEEVNDRAVISTVAYVSSQLAKGRNLGSCLERDFVPDLVMVMKSSHAPKVLLNTITDIKKLYDERRSIRQKAISRFVYPVVLLLTSLLALWLSGVVILPRLTDMLTVIELPFWTRQLSLLANSLPWLVAVSLLVLLGFYGTRYIAAAAEGIVSRLINKMKINQVYRLFILVDICYQLGLLLSQRCNMGETVSLLKQSSKGLAEKHYQFMQERLAAGYVSLAEVMNSELVDRITLMRLQMSHGATTERSVQLHAIAASVQQRAVRLMHHKIRWGVACCYSISLLVIAIVVMGVGQVIMLMVGQWS